MFEIASNILTNDFFLQYEQNFTLITIFCISFLFFRIFLKDPLSQEEHKRRRERAEVYLNKYKNIDEDFFNGAVPDDLAAN